MTSYLFVLGRVPDLSFLEVSSLYESPRRIDVHLAEAVVPDDMPPASVMDELGGATKIAEIIGTIPDLSAETVAQYLIGPNKNLTYGISIYQDLSFSGNLLQDIKGHLQEQGIKASYVTGHGKKYLDSVVITKKNVTELILYSDRGKLAVARTIAVQDFEKWSARDFQRPFADPHSGMLPPKAARMIIHIAMNKKKNATLIDPFCGMGTIVTEAAAIGLNAIGSDFSEDVIQKARSNIEWYKNNNLLSQDATYSIFVSDATDISSKIPQHSVDAVVTEPFLGKAGSFTSPEKTKNILRGLAKLYIGCLRDWHKVLTHDGVVMMAFPSVFIHERELTVKKPIDMCENLGYTKVLGPIEYARENAQVKRHFYLFSRRS